MRRLRRAFYTWCNAETPEQTAKVEADLEMINAWLDAQDTQDWGSSKTVTG